MIVMRGQLNVKKRQAISETPAKGGGGGLVETLNVTPHDLLRRFSHENFGYFLTFLPVLPRVFHMFLPL